MGRLVLLILITTSLFSLDYSSLPDDELLFLAETGDLEATYILGMLLEELELEGDNLRFNTINKDPYYWITSAADSGFPKAQTKLGKEYLTSYGHFNTQDFKKAYEYFLKSSNQDNEASLFISLILFHGLGMEKDTTLAIQYFNKSQQDFFRIKSFIYLEDKLIEMVQELVKENNPNALFVLGDLYYFGKSDYYKQDYKKAFRIYQKGGELGSHSCQYMAGMMTYNGVGTLKDLNQSYMWIKSSADGGNTSAKVKLGIMSYFGEGTEMNWETAFENFKVAAEKDDSLAQYFIGVMYYKGEGTEIDMHQSKVWIKKAYENGSPSAEKFWNAKELWKISEPEGTETDSLKLDDSESTIDETSETNLTME